MIVPNSMFLAHFDISRAFALVEWPARELGSSRLCRERSACDGVPGAIGWLEKHPGSRKEERRDVSARLAKPDHRSARADPGGRGRLLAASQSDRPGAGTTRRPDRPAPDR